MTARPVIVSLDAPAARASASKAASTAVDSSELEPSRTRRQIDVSDWRITLRADTDAILPDARLVEGQAVLR
ncbi:MAG: hypothetical protein IT370_14370 [Deltaproteobacteria bacterium]|nr:hypothetical protein [Deltaproteobacteria bacterium]